MVSFSCEVCGDVLTKKKLDPHRQRCWGANFTCIDCMTHFPGTEYRSHTSCMTEEQKYQGALYRPKKGKGQQNQNQNQNRNRNQNNSQAMAQPAYVEEVAEDFDTWRQYDNNGNTPAQAPTPPSATEAPVNVFDYMVNPTPTASRVSVAEETKESNEMVRYESKADETTENAVVHYETPAQKKKSKDGEKEVKKDKKRKRELHIETDHPMTDAPPVLHSGLTGGISRMMSRPDAFPPSPESAETPASPLKKSKHSKHHKSESLGNSLMAMIAGSKTKKSKTSKSKDLKDKKEKKSSSGSPSSKKHKSSHSKSLEAPKEQKMIEYRPGSKDSATDKDKDNQVVIFQPRAERFLSFVNKGPGSDKGVSLNKALKRYHRERSASGTSVSKLAEEKELWRSLRMRRNDRGEIVLFCV